MCFNGGQAVGASLVGAHECIANSYRGCVIIHFSSADCADDADYSFLLYPIGYNLSASSAQSADEELNGGIFDTASRMHSRPLSEGGHN